MAEESYPFQNSPVATEAQWARMARMFCSDGVFMASPSDQALKVTANGTSSITVQAGEAQVNGFHYRNDTPLTRSVPTNFGGASPRVDMVVLRCSQTSNGVTVVYRTGGTSAPALAGDRNDIFDLPLAQVTIAAGSATAASGAVVDRRYSPAPPAAFGSVPNRTGVFRWTGSLAFGDGVNWHPVMLDDLRPNCKAYQSGTGQVLPNNGAREVVLNGEEWDTAGMHATSGEPGVRKITVPTAGIYDVRGAVAFDSSGIGLRTLAVIKNGTIPSGDALPSGGSAIARTSLPAASSGETSFQCGTRVALDAGEWLSLRATQTSGGNLGLNPGPDRVFLQVEWVRSA